MTPSPTFAYKAARALLALLAVTALGVGVAAPVSAAPSAAPQTVPLDPPDPGDTGPFGVTATEYNDGDTAFTPPGFGHAVEVRASVHYPTGLPGGPYPLVMLMHGRHSTCYKGSQATGGWPCPAGYQTIPSFQGYDYLANNLASWGYIVVSVSANGINAFDSGSSDAGMTARGQLMQLHLDKWKTFSTTGGSPFGTTFVGKVNMQNVGEMGHSRGGEGVVRNYEINKSLGSPYGIKAILPLAPVDFGREKINNVPMSVILPYCDGDVSDLQGVHFYDDSRYTVADESPRFTQEVIGANDNYFNTVWTPGEFPAGTFNDTTCPSFALTAAQQRAVGLAYMAAFFRIFLGGETAFMPYFDGTTIEPPSVEPAAIHTAYLAGASQRRDVNRYLDSTSLTTNQLGGAVTAKKLTPFDLCGGASPQPQFCLSGASSSQQPHNTGARPGLSQLRYGWDVKKAKVSNGIPAGSGNVSGFAALTFRIARTFTDARNPAGVPTDLKVMLTDSSGSKATVDLASWSDALFAQPGSGSGLPKLVHNSVRIPLSAFGGIDLTHVTKITFRHNAVSQGAVLTTDLAFTD